MVCDVAEIAAGVGLVWDRRDGVGVAVVAAVPCVEVSVALAVGVPSALSMLAALAPVDVAVPSSTVSAVAFVLVRSSALPVPLLVASACACCTAAA